MADKESKHEKATVSTSADGTRKLVRRPRITLKNLSSSVSQSNVLAPSTPKLFHDSAPPPDKPHTTPSKASSREEMVKYMKATLSALAELVGERAVGFPTVSTDSCEVGLSSLDRLFGLTVIP
jgi:hypothetical protein